MIRSGRGHWAPVVFWAGIFFLLLRSVPCVGHPGAVEPVAEGVLLDVPFHQQTDYQCGPAALASLLNYWDDPVTAKQVAEKVISNAARGTMTLDLYLFATKRGYLAEHGRLTLDRIREELRAGRPALVLVDEGIWIIRQGHFLVVTGFDETGVYVHDGRHRNRRIGYSLFQRKWDRARGWGMLVRRPESQR